MDRLLYIEYGALGRNVKARNERPYGDLSSSAYLMTLEAFRQGVASPYYKGR
jgi:hypothetical protein